MHGLFYCSRDECRREVHEEHSPKRIIQESLHLSLLNRQCTRLLKLISISKAVERPREGDGHKKRRVMMCFPFKKWRRFFFVCEILTTTRRLSDLTDVDRKFADG